jgi:hypothetical protein
MYDKLSKKIGTISWRLLQNKFNMCNQESLPITHNVWHIYITMVSIYVIMNLNKFEKQKWIQSTKNILLDCN